MTPRRSRPFSTRCAVALVASLAMAGCNENTPPRGRSTGQGVVVLPGGEIWAFLDVRNLVIETTPDALFPRRTGDADTFIYGLPPDASAPLYASFFGGNNTESILFARPDNGGNILFGGETTSGNFPTTGGAVDEKRNSRDAWVALFDPRARTLLYSTLLGGTSVESAQSATRTAGGEFLVVGTTQSKNFLPGIDVPRFGKKGGNDAFVVRLSADGAAIVGAAVFGAGSEDSPRAVAEAPDGTVLVCGSTRSKQFPTTPGSYQDKINQKTAGFVTKFSPDLTTILWSTFLAGGKYDQLSNLHVRPDGAIWLVGTTRSKKFPVTPGSLSSKLGGKTDALIAALTPGGDELFYATFLGGKKLDRGVSSSLAGTRLFIAGPTKSVDFPVTANAAQADRPGETDLFVAVFDIDARSLVYATFLGGWEDEECPTPSCILAESPSRVAVAGLSWSLDIPITPGVFGPSPFHDWDNAFVTVIDVDSGQILTSTFLGGRVKD